MKILHKLEKEYSLLWRVKEIARIRVNSKKIIDLKFKLFMKSGLIIKPSDVDLYWVLKIYFEFIMM